jgi:hypothetical protein
MSSGMGSIGFYPFHSVLDVTIEGAGFGSQRWSEVGAARHDICDGAAYAQAEAVRTH